MKKRRKEDAPLVGGMVEVDPPEPTTDELHCLVQHVDAIREYLEKYHASDIEGSHWTVGNAAIYRYSEWLRDRALKQLGRIAHERRCCR